MQFNTIILAVISLGASAFAQDLSKVPTCAIGPATAAFGKTGCAPMDIKCVCGKSQLIPELQAEVSKACSPEDMGKAAAFAVETCRSVGVEIKLP